jgi:uncharacterized RDD family membrane protein YckC
MTQAALAYPVGRRIVAALIDIAVLAGLYLVLVALFGDFESGTRTGPDGEETTSFNANLEGAGFVLYVLLVLGYYIVLELILRATVGKLAMGLRVRSVDGGEAALSGIFFRNVLRIVDALPFLYIVGLVSVAVTQHRQRMGDLAGKTVVVRTKDVANSGDRASPA